MSVMDYGLGRRYTPHHSLSFPDYYYDNRSAPCDVSHAGRADPRGFHFGGSVGGSRSRPGSERDEVEFDTGPSRRRIAVAVSAKCSPFSPVRVRKVS
jgi:hypothetical protein